MAENSLSSQKIASSLFHDFLFPTQLQRGGRVVVVSSPWTQLTGKRLEQSDDCRMWPSQLTSSSQSCGDVLRSIPRLVQTIVTASCPFFRLLKPINIVNAFLYIFLSFFFSFILVFYSCRLLLYLYCSFLFLPHSVSSPFFLIPGLDLIATPG